MATPEGVVRDDSGGELENGDMVDAQELQRRAALRHCGWVPSSFNGVEVSPSLSRLSPRLEPDVGRTPGLPQALIRAWSAAFKPGSVIVLVLLLFRDFRDLNSGAASMAAAVRLGSVILIYAII